MTTSKTLAEKLAAHPELEKRVSELIDIVEAKSGHLDRADEAENAVIDNLRELGNKLLKDWGAYKENQKFEEVCDLHPEAVAKKSTYWMSTYGKACLAYKQGSRDKRYRVVMGKPEEKLPDSIPSEHF